MALNKVVYVDNQTTITAEQMNAIQDAIIENSNRLDNVPSSVNAALAEAKASGEFDGPQGPQGDPYTLTEGDKAELVSAVVAALPVYNGEAVEV